MTDSSDDQAHNFFDAVQKAIDHSPPGAGKPSVEGFDAISDHVAVLLSDAVEAFDRRSFGTAVFLAITSMEETAKAEVLAYRRVGETSKGRDPLRSHDEKHRIAVRPTTFMGRLPNLIGADACDRLQNMAATGGFRLLRERALYVDFAGGTIIAPSSAIDRRQAREILLLALECADDILVGYTDHSYDVGRQFEVWIDHVASSSL